MTWETSWTWAGGPSNVKSYAQIQDGAPTDYEQLSDITSYTTEWSWSYSGDDIVADVSYDTFTCSDSTSGCTDFEVMVWLAAIGGAGPISSTGSTIATPSIGGYEWNLYSGPNGAMTVYSFVASSEITSFSGDIMDFYNYLIDNEGFPSTQYLKTISVGTFLQTKNFQLNYAVEKLLLTFYRQAQRHSLAQMLCYHRHILALELLSKPTKALSFAIKFCTMTELTSDAFSILSIPILTIYMQSKGYLYAFQLVLFLCINGLSSTISDSSSSSYSSRSSAAASSSASPLL